MKEYEVVAKMYNACAGSGRPQTFFEETELENTDDYVRIKHGKDFSKFQERMYQYFLYLQSEVQLLLCQVML